MLATPPAHRCARRARQKQLKLFRVIWGWACLQPLPLRAAPHHARRQASACLAPPQPAESTIFMCSGRKHHGSTPHASVDAPARAHRRRSAVLTGAACASTQSCPPPTSRIMYRRVARKRSTRSLVVSLPPPRTGATLPHSCQHNPGRSYIPSALALPRQRSHAAPEHVATKRPAAPFVSLRSGSLKNRAAPQPRQAQSHRRAHRPCSAPPRPNRPQRCSPLRQAAWQARPSLNCTAGARSK
jgi:hypothetical protein